MRYKGFFSLFQRQKYGKDPRFILLLTEERISLFFFSTAHQPSLIRLTQISFETPVSYLISFLKKGPGIPLDIFHDMPDQTLKIETIPANLRGLDPYRWVRHKRRSLLEGATFSGSYGYPQKNKNGRSVLFAFFPICPSLGPLFQELETLSHPLQVYALALEQVDMYQQLHTSLASAPTAWLLGVHFEESGRMRHTVMHEGRFVLSRLFPPLTASQTSFSQEENRTREIQGTLRYVMKQFAIPPCDIQTIFWGEKLSAPTLSQTTDQEHWILSSPQSASLLKLPALLSDFETVFLAWFYNRRSPAFLSLKRQPKGIQKILGSLKQGGLLFTWSVSVGLWITTGMIFLHTQHQKDDMTLLQKKCMALKEQQAAVDQELAALPLTADQARQFLSLRQDLDLSSAILLKIVEKLGAALGSDMRLRHLDWHAEGGDLTHSLTIEGYCLASTLSQKELTPLFDRFLERLQDSFPESTLDILHGPYSTHQTQLLTGGIHEEDLPSDPTCIVKISW